MNRARLRWWFAAVGLVMAVAVTAATGEDRSSLGWASLGTDVTVEVAAAEVDQLQPLDPDDVQLPATSSGQRHWLRWQLPTSAVSADAGQRVVVVDRAMIEHIEIHQRNGNADWQATAIEGFFRPASGEGLADSFSARISGSSTELMIAVDAQVPSRFRLRVADEREHLLAGAAAGNWAAAAYACLVSVAIAALALTLALREAIFRRFPLFAAAMLLFLLASSGHLYAMPGGGMLAGLGVALPMAAGLAVAAAALALSNALLGLTSMNVPMTRWAERTAQAGGVLALVALVVPPSMRESWLQIASMLVLLGLLAPVAMSAWSWSLGSRLAAALCPLWAALLALMGIRLGWMAGWWGGGELSLVYYPFGIAVVVLMLSVGLTDRMVAIRREHDRTRSLHEESSATLQWEQHRRRFAEALRDLARTANLSGDLEWRALRLLVQAVSDVVPARSFSISASGYRGFDYLLTEPMSAKAHICAVLAERSATLKGICRSRTPIQVVLDVPAVAGAAEARAQFAVVPLAVPKPGWGALLMERELGNEFLPDDLAVVGELVALTLAAIEEGVEKAELKRDAELDPLTGLLSKRAGDLRMDSMLRASYEGKSALSLLFVDVDQMVQINGKYGVDVGDECLRGVAACFRGVIGKDDVVFRHAGDEFLLLLPGQTPEQVRDLAERLRAAVAALRIKAAAGPLKVTVSIGVAGRAAGDETAQKLIDRAERAAGTAKAGGRNRVALAVAHAGQGDAPDRSLHF